MNKKKLYLTIFMVSTLFALSGCKKELTLEEVAETEYYQKLEKTNKELDNKVTELEEEVNQLSKELLELKESSDEQENNLSTNKDAEAYFDKIKNSSLIQVEIGYTDGYKNPVFVKNSAVCDYVRQLVDKADLTANYTYEELRKEMGEGYIYTMYEEDDTIFEMEVYKEGYMVFSDLPGQVYYCPGSTSVGEAFLMRKGSYPNSNLLHRMADSAMVVCGKKAAWNQEKSLEIANYINSMEKREVSDDRESDVKKECVFYSFGNQMTLKIYKTHICIISWDGEENWYQAEKEDVEELKELLK